MKLLTYTAKRPWIINTHQYTPLLNSYMSQIIEIPNKTQGNLKLVLMLSIQTNKSQYL